MFEIHFPTQFISSINNSAKIVFIVSTRRSKITTIRLFPVNVPVPRSFDTADVIVTGYRKLFSRFDRAVILLCPMLYK